MRVNLFLAPATAGKTQYGLDYVQQVRQDDPLAAVWVVMPDAAQASAFRRRLAQTGGSINVQTVTFSNLYAELLALVGQPVARLDDPVLHRLLRAIVDGLHATGELPYYAAIHNKPGFLQALREEIRELKQRRITPERFTAVTASHAPHLQELARIYSRYQHWLQTHHWADDEGRGWLAALALEANHNLCAGWRLLLVDGFDHFNPTQLEVLRRLAAQAQETIITLTGADLPRLAHHRFDRARQAIEAALGVTAEPLPHAPGHGPSAAGEGVAAPLAYLEQTLFEASAPGPPPADKSLQLLAAPNPAEEARAALRWLKQQHVSHGVPLPELAVLARDLTLYRPFLAETASEFGLPLQLAQGTWLHENPAITALLNLLALPARNWPRRLLIEAWRSPYFDWSTEGLTLRDADLLAAVARHGQVIAGWSQWRETLDRLARTQLPSEAAITMAEDSDETAVLELPRGEQAARLRQKLERFVQRLTPQPQATFSQYTRWVEELIGDDPSLVREPRQWRQGASLAVVARARPIPLTAERDVAALQRLKDVLRGLVFAEVSLGQPQSVSYGRFWQELRGAVEAATYRPPPPGDQGAILAAPVLAARGLSFHAVALLGLSEGEFPRALRQDPLLRQSDRAALAADGVLLELPQPADETTLFYEAVTRARQRLLVTRSYLAGDGQPWEPSPYWEQLIYCSGAAARTVRAEDWLSPTQAASPAEFLAALAHSLARPEGVAVAAAYQAQLPAAPALAAEWQAVQMGAAVLSARLAAAAHSVYEGDLRQLEPYLAAMFDPERPWSASRLESYGVCAHAFFAGYVLGFDPRQPAAAGYDVRQLGNMIHAILEEVYGQVAETGQSPADLLPPIAGRIFDAAPETYGFRPTPLWQQQRQELTHILARTITALEGESAGWRPAHLELPFGLQEAPPLTLTGTDGVTLHLRGYIDRVDVDEDGRLRIIDYKTSATPITPRELADGQRLQLALYALAARDVLQLGQPATGMYWHVGSAKPSRLQLHAFEDGIEAALNTAVQYALSYAAGARQGHFAPHPPPGGCPAWCPAADYCWRYTPKQ